MPTYRLGLAGRVIAGLLAMTIFSLAGITLAVVAFERVRTGLYSIAEDKFKSALTASDVARQSQAVATVLASAGPQLKVAASQSTRSEVSSAIAQQVQKLRDLLGRLSAGSIDPESVTEVRRAGAMLIEQIAVLDAAVLARIDLDDANRDFVRRIYDMQTEVEKIVDEIGASAEPWRDAADTVSGLLFPALAQKESGDLEALSLRAGPLSTALSTAAAKIMGARGDDIAKLTRQLTDLTDPTSGVIAIRRKQLQAQADVERNLSLQSSAIDGFGASVNRLIERISSDVGDDYGDLTKMVEQQRQFLILLAAGGLIGALGIAIYVNQGVVRRLTRLRDTMLDRVAGRPSAIVTSGHDEISDMALALEHFVLTIEASEANLRIAREAADAANQAKSGFLAAMSHEIRTPMNGVTTMAELLIRTRLNDEQKSIAQVIIDSGVSLLAIINDILDFSKIEAGKIDLEWVDVDVALLAEGVGKLLEARASERGLSLHVDLDPALPALVRADPTRLRQILLNLVGNAIKFTESGSVTLSIRALTKPIDGETTNLRFAVSDTGIGLTPEQKSRLFKPFSQADGSITRRFGGTGLGLSICKRLTEMMDGRIDVDSEAGVGSTFHFTLPLVTLAVARDGARAQAAANAPLAWREWIAPDPEVAASNGVRLLAADDNPTNRLVLSALFERLGYVVDLVKDGEEAWTALSNGEYGLLLTDCHMPNLDGFALTRRVRAAEAAGDRLDRLPIVALTADAVSGAVEECLKAGMDGYVAKPINVALLDETIQRLLPAAGDWRRPKSAAPEPIEFSPDETSMTPGEPDAGALDLAVVEENFGAIGPDAREMLDMFLSSTAPLIDDLERALDAGDDEAARDAAHSSRGAANMAGASHLGALLAQIEAALRADDATMAKVLFPAVRPAFAAVEEAVARLLDQVGVG